MPKLRYLAVAVAIPALAASSLSARDRMSRECRQEIIKLCGIQRSDMLSCILRNRQKVSEPCRAELKERATGSHKPSAAAVPEITPGAPPRELSYGSDPLQKMDYFGIKTSIRPPQPLIINVHGGGWKRGDKSNATGSAKAPHYQAQGYAFATINYRLIPESTVEQQAGDVASALAYLIGNAAQLGFDHKRVVLTGHSAGAHLVALVGTDPQYLRAVGLDYSALRGIIPNDGAAYDVAAQMTDGPKIMQKTYAQAFGSDPARQRALSPAQHAAAPNAPAFLFINVQRPDGIRQANGLAEALRKAGTPAAVRLIPGEGLKGHMEINRKLGEPDYPATPVVDAWIKSVLN